jgi:hypothetical protein
MKLMSLKLLRGKIDGVNNTVSVDWIQPRELDINSIKGLGAQLNVWSEQ